MKNDISGKKFFRLTVIERIKKKGRFYLHCRCDCGNEKDIYLSSVENGISKSCGCYRREKSLKTIVNNFTTHDMSKTRFNSIFRGIKYRCNNANCRAYMSYGGRGIRCEWKSFEAFRDDMYQSYLDHCAVYGEKNTSINRIDNDGNYSKENCEWEVAKNQARNRKTSHFVKYLGQNRTITEWSEITGVQRSTLERRIRVGWSVEKALTTKVQ